MTTATSVPKVFAAGDTRRGQSLVVWAIREGRQCARAVDLFADGQHRVAALSRSSMSARRHARTSKGWRPGARTDDARERVHAALEEGGVDTACRGVGFCADGIRARASSRRRGRTGARKTSASTARTLKGALAARPIARSSPR